jgi:hypothetical protein
MKMTLIRKIVDLIIYFIPFYRLCIFNIINFIYIYNFCIIINYIFRLEKVYKILAIFNLELKCMPIFKILTFIK